MPAVNALSPPTHRPGRAGVPAGGHGGVPDPARFPQFLGRELVPDSGSYFRRRETLGGGAAPPRILPGAELHHGRRPGSLFRQGLSRMGRDPVVGGAGGGPVGGESSSVGGSPDPGRLGGGSRPGPLW